MASVLQELPPGAIPLDPHTGAPLEGFDPTTPRADQPLQTETQAIPGDAATQMGLPPGSIPLDAKTGKPLDAEVVAANERSFAKKVLDWVTGDTPQEEDLPAVGTIAKGLTTYQKLKVAGGMLATPEEKDQAAIIKASIPGVKVSNDKFGNFIVEFGKETPELNGQRFSVNPAGGDMQDLFNVIAEVVKFTPAAKFAAAGGSAASKIGRAVFADSVTQATSEGVSSVLGADISPTDAAIRVGVAGLGAGVTQAISDLLIPFVREAFRKKKYAVNGELTPAGRQAAELAGIDPDIADEAFSNIFAKELAKQQKRVVTPRGLGKVGDAIADEQERFGTRVAAGEALSKRFGVDATRGQISGDIQQQTAEGVARNTGPTKEVFKDFDKGQQDQLTAAAQRIQGRLGPNQAGSVPEAAGITFDALKTKSLALRESITEAFDLAKSKESLFTGEKMTDLSRRVGEIAREFPIDRSRGRNRAGSVVPGAERVLGEINFMAKRAAKMSRRRAKGRSNRAIFLTLKDFDQSRRRMLKIIKNIPNSTPEDKALAIELRRSYDDFIDDAVRQELFLGEPDALDDLLKARELRTDLRLNFGKRNATDEAGKIIDHALQFDATPEQFASAVLGANRLGGKDVSSKVVDRLADTLGRESAEFGSIKEAAFLKLTQGIDPAKPKDPALVARDIDRFFRDSPTLAKKLWSADEQKIIKQYAQLNRFIKPDSLATNPSRTAFMERDILRKATSDTLRVAQQKFVFGGKAILGNTLGVFRRALLGDRVGGRNLKAARESLQEIVQQTSFIPTAAGAGLSVSLSRVFDEEDE